MNWKTTKKPIKKSGEQLVKIKKTKVVKEKPPKTRNSGTMTESAFWSFIRSKMRQASRWWKPIQECKQAAKRPYKGPNTRQKFEYLCSECGLYYPEKFVSIDHIIPCGSLTKADDLPGFVERLFCSSEHLRCVCDPCHQIITNEHREKLKLEKQNGNIQSE